MAKMINSAAFTEPRAPDMRSMPYAANKALTAPVLLTYKNPRSGDCHQ